MRSLADKPGRFICSRLKRLSVEAGADLGTDLEVGARTLVSSGLFIGHVKYYFVLPFDDCSHETRVVKSRAALPFSHVRQFFLQSFLKTADRTALTLTSTFKASKSSGTKKREENLAMLEWFNWCKCTTPSHLGVDNGQT